MKKSIRMPGSERTAAEQRRRTFVEAESEGQLVRRGAGRSTENTRDGAADWYGFTDCSQRSTSGMPVANLPGLTSTGVSSTVTPCRAIR